MLTRVTKAEHKMLSKLAEHDGVSVADVIRVLVREQFRKVFGKG